MSCERMQSGGPTLFPCGRGSRSAAVVDFAMRASLQYPLVEGATAIIFVLIGVSTVALPLKGLALPVAALFVAIAVYDLCYTIIPDAWGYTCAALSLAASLIALWGRRIRTHSSARFLRGPLPQARCSPSGSYRAGNGWDWVTPNSRLDRLASRSSVGLLCGLLRLHYRCGRKRPAFIFFIGAVAGMREFIKPSLWSLSPAGFTMQSEVPFGPFLIVSCFIVWFSLMYNIQLPFVWQ